MGSNLAPCLSSQPRNAGFFVSWVLIYVLFLSFRIQLLSKLTLRLARLLDESHLPKCGELPNQE